MLEISGDWWYYDKDTNMIWASHNSSGILDVNIATLTDSNFDANNGRLIAAAPDMYEMLFTLFNAEYISPLDIEILRRKWEKLIPRIKGEVDEHD